LDAGVLPIDLDVVRLTLHVLAATIWVGGQIVLAALVGVLRRVAPEAVAPAARVFAWVGWPAFAVLIVTGFWNLQVSGRMAPGGMAGGYGATLLVKMALVLLSGLGAALHTFAKSFVLKGVWATVGLASAVGALLLGVSMGRAG
jgi:putative copper export protein